MHTNLVDKRALAREVNERIRAIDAAFGASVTLEVLCECDVAGCVQRLEVPSSVYEELCSDLERFVVAAGHEGRDWVLSEGIGYRVVAVAAAAAYAS